MGPQAYAFLASMIGCVAKTPSQAARPLLDVIGRQSIEHVLPLIKNKNED